MKLILSSLICLTAVVLGNEPENEPKAENKSKEYRLETGDVINMTMWEEDDMTKQAVITKTGKVSLPLLNDPIEVKGLTVEEVQDKLIELYKEDLFVNPRVSITIHGYAKKWVTVSGAVLNPGNFLIPEDGKFNLAEAVARAGGVLPQGNSRSITLAKRKGGSKKYVLANSGEVALESGDTIVVPMIPVERNVVAKTATVSGKVSKPGPIALPREGKVDVLTAIALAGGFDKIANQRTAILQRKLRGGGFQPAEINIRGMRDGNVKVAHLFEGDILIIKESRF